jgi:hypothetical protein
MKTNRRVLALAFSLLFPVWGGASSPPDTGSRDGQLLAQGQEKLAHAKVGDKVDLKVENAAATLSGTVDSIAVKERASKEILKVPGIVITMKLPSSNSRDAQRERHMGRIDVLPHEFIRK